MSMTLRALALSLKSSLRDSAKYFESETDADDGELKRLITLAAADLHRVRPYVFMTSITLVANQACYPCPADLQRFKQDYWWSGDRAKPWENNWPGTNPRVRVVNTAEGRQLCFQPAPTSHQIGVLGQQYSFDYFGIHQVGVEEITTTVQPEDRGLLLLRAQAEAMKELAIRNMHKPVQLRDGLNSAPKNGSPAAVFEQLMREFERQGQPC